MAITSLARNAIEEAASFPSMVTYLVAMRLFDGWGMHP
jgi:hypothetical protein